MIVGTIDARFNIEVIPEGDGYQGSVRLIDNRTNTIVASKATNISYAAQFGPDIGDVQRWGEWATMVVDTYLEEKRAK